MNKVKLAFINVIFFIPPSTSELSFISNTGYKTKLLLDKADIPLAEAICSIFVFNLLSCEVFKYSELSGTITLIGIFFACIPIEHIMQNSVIKYMDIVLMFYLIVI